jgi:23S rRNA pseudouridine2457 synthase
MLLAFNKPFGVLSQFTNDGSSNRTLAEFGFPKRVYPIGRLDADSEGLLLLSDEADLNQKLLNPRYQHEREYWAQVERIPSKELLSELAKGVRVQGRKSLPAKVWIMEPQPIISPRDPPVRVRKTIPTCWLALKVVEGKNRQVRRMTAAVGHPTLRLIRVRIGKFALSDLAPGAWSELAASDRKLVFI